MQLSLRDRPRAATRRARECGRRSPPVFVGGSDADGSRWLGRGLRVGTRIGDGLDGGERRGADGRRDAGGRTDDRLGRAVGARRVVTARAPEASFARRRGTATMTAELSVT